MFRGQIADGVRADKTSTALRLRVGVRIHGRALVDFVRGLPGDASSEGKAIVSGSSQTGASAGSPTKPSTQFVGFRLADQEYAFRIEQIQEIVKPDRVTRMPQVPDYIEGVSNLRGTIIPIVNLRRLFSLEAKEADEETRTIVVNIGSKTIGCTVDSVMQVIRITPDQIQPAPDLVKSEGAAYVLGFAKLESRLIVLLEIQELLDPSKMEQVREIASRGGAFGAK